MRLTPIQIGVLRDVAAGKVSLDDCSEWMRDKLCELVWFPGPELTDTRGPEVFLTEAGHKLLKEIDAPQVRTKWLGTAK